MPVVPFTRREAPAPTGPELDEKYIVMAAAQMHQLGRLFEPEPATPTDLSRIPVDRHRIGIDDNALVGKEQSRGKVLSPDKVMKDKDAEDPRNIYDDSGQIADYDLKDYGKRK